MAKPADRDETHPVIRLMTDARKQTDPDEFLIAFADRLRAGVAANPLGSF